jgi:hypothetical protein
MYRSTDKSLARPTSRCILFDGEIISFDASLVICINSTNIPGIDCLCSLVFEDVMCLKMKATVGFEMPGTTCCLTALHSSRQEFSLSLVLSVHTNMIFTFFYVS